MNAAFVVLRPFPVLVACQGCLEVGQGARETALLLDRRGFGELAWLGGSGLDQVRTKVRNRFPIYCLDACHKGCARAWVEGQGVAPQRCFALSEAERADIDRAARRIAME